MHKQSITFPTKHMLFAPRSLQYSDLSIYCSFLLDPPQSQMESITILQWNKIRAQQWRQKHWHFTQPIHVLLHCNLAAKVHNTSFIHKQLSLLSQLRIHNGHRRKAIVTCPALIAMMFDVSLLLLPHRHFRAIIIMSHLPCHICHVKFVVSPFVVYAMLI